MTNLAQKRRVGPAPPFPQRNPHNKRNKSIHPDETLQPEV
jgi:hypothetical protein